MEKQTEYNVEDLKPIESKGICFYLCSLQNQKELNPQTQSYL